MPDALPITETPDWTRYAAGALVEAFADATIAGGARTPFVDYNGALAPVSPTDLGIHAARAALARAGIEGSRLGATIAGNCTQASFDSLFFARHIGLYAGMRNDRRMACSGSAPPASRPSPRPPASPAPARRKRCWRSARRA
jgi:hypothetical protein